MSFETVALFPGSCSIKFKTSFLEIVSLPKFSFIFLQLSSFSKFIFPVDSRRFKPLVIFVKYSLKVLEIFLFSLRVSISSVKIMLLLVLHLKKKKRKRKKEKKFREKRLNCSPKIFAISYFIYV